MSQVESRDSPVWVDDSLGHGKLSHGVGTVMCLTWQKWELRWMITGSSVKFGILILPPTLVIRDGVGHIISGLWEGDLAQSDLGSMANESSLGNMVSGRGNSIYSPVYKLWKMEVEDGRIKFDVPIVWLYLKRRNARWVALTLISWVKMKTVRMQLWNCEVICQQLQTRVIKNRIRSKNQKGKVNFIFPIE